jgi:hypothetical protein
MSRVRRLGGRIHERNFFEVDSDLSAARKGLIRAELSRFFIPCELWLAERVVGETELSRVLIEILPEEVSQHSPDGNEIRTVLEEMKLESAGLLVMNESREHPAEGRGVQGERRKPQMTSPGAHRGGTGGTDQTQRVGSAFIER